MCIAVAPWIRIRTEIKSWIRIRIETNAGPHHWLKETVSRYLYPITWYLLNLCYGKTLSTSTKSSASEHSYYHSQALSQLGTREDFSSVSDFMIHPQLKS